MSRYMLSLYLHKPGLDTRFETFPQGVFFQQRSRGYVRAFAPLTPQSFGTLVECMRPSIGWEPLLQEIGRSVGHWTWFERSQRVHAAMLDLFPPAEYGFKQDEGSWLGERLRFRHVLTIRKHEEWQPHVADWPLFHNLLMQSKGLRMHEQIEFMDLDLSKSYGRGDASDKRVSAVDEGQRQL